MRVWVVVVLLAGCSAPADPVDEVVWPSPQWAIDALEGGQGHDHKSYAQHVGRSTPNFRSLGYDPQITAFSNATSGGYLCGEAATFDNRTIAVTQSHFEDVALVVADVTDAANPKLLGELVLEGVGVYDSALTDDGRYAIVAVTGANGRGVPVEVAVRATWKSSCGASSGPYVMLTATPSVLLVDLSDPTHPVVVDQFQQPGASVHSVSAATVDGVHYVASSALGGLGPSSYFTFLTIGPDALGEPGFQFFGVYEAGNLQSLGLSRGLFPGHTDATIHKHPVTGQTLAYLATWDGGVIVVDLVAPGVVRHVSNWGAFLEDSRNLAIHSTLPLDVLWGDRHVTIVGEETITPIPGLPTGRVFVLDTTDPAVPKEAAIWTLPVEEGGWDEPLIFSPHYAAVVNHTVFVSMYHGGVWAFDAAPENWPHPPTVGVFLPARESPAKNRDVVGGWGVMTMAPSVLEVLALPDGTLVSWDSMAGIHTYRFEPDARVQPVPNWFER